jgi:uncharacterized membrane protein
MPNVDYESTPLNRSEYITALVHLYRGELYRANSGRIRLDNTTNWAVLTTAGLLTFSFGQGAHTHWVLLMGTGLISVFLGFEARRFRFAHVWRSRVRMIEENFYGPILRRDPISPEREWGTLVAEDLFQPRFKISRMGALRARFARNYWAIYLVLTVAWVIKLLSLPGASMRERLELGMIPWWVPLAYLGLLASGILWLFIGTPRVSKDLEQWNMELEGGDQSTALDL